MIEFVQTPASLLGSTLQGIQSKLYTVGLMYSLNSRVSFKSANKSGFNNSVRMWMEVGHFRHDKLLKFPRAKFSQWLVGGTMRQTIFMWMWRPMFMYVRYLSRHHWTLPFHWRVKRTIRTCTSAMMSETRRTMKTTDPYLIFRTIDLQGLTANPIWLSLDTQPRRTKCNGDARQGSAVAIPRGSTGVLRQHESTDTCIA